MTGKDLFGQAPAREGIAAKVDYVKKQRQTRKHHCHWTGCDKQVPPAMWGCREHWYRLPKRIRDRIWATFRPGQEVSATPSPAYVAAAKEAQAWIAQQEQPGGTTNFFEGG